MAQQGERRSRIALAGIGVPAGAEPSAVLPVTTFAFRASAVNPGPDGGSNERSNRDLPGRTAEKTITGHTDPMSTRSPVVGRSNGPVTPGDGLAGRYPIVVSSATSASNSINPQYRTERRARLAGISLPTARGHLGRAAEIGVDMPPLCTVQRAGSRPARMPGVGVA